MDCEIATLLEFIGGGQKTSLQGWRRATRDTINDIKETLREYASYETNLEASDAPTLSCVYSLFSVLCILISEEFDAALVLFVEGDTVPLTSLFPEETPPDAVIREADWIAQIVRLEWEKFARLRGLKSVRTMTPYEMKICLQERGLISRDHPTGKRSASSKNSYAISRIVWGNLHITIDPFTPPDLAAKKVENLLQEYQEKHVKELEESWANEVAAGVVNRAFAVQNAKEEQLRFDYRRAYKGNKKSRGEGTTFEIWLRRLEVYDLARRPLTAQKIIERLERHYNNLTREKISQDKSQARAYIDAALCGIPISVVQNIRCKRE